MNEKLAFLCYNRDLGKISFQKWGLKSDIRQIYNIFKPYFLINLSLYLILSPSLSLRPMASLMERHLPSDTISSSEVRKEATSLP